MTALGEYPSVTALVNRTASGDQDAWNRIVERYAPLVYSIASPPVPVRISVASCSDW
jgi:hypothetical protein